MNNLVKRVLSFSLAFILVSTFIPFFSASATTQSNNSRLPRVNTSDDFSIINKAKSLCVDESKDLKIIANKVLYGFDGTIFLLTEFEGMGYMISHAISGEIVEYSVSAPSPYNGFISELYYAGPTLYYVFNGADYVHTITGDKISISDTYYISSLRNASSQINQDLNENASILQRDYASNFNTTDSIGQIAHINADTNSTYYISGGARLKYMSTEKLMGYMSGGVCGYIATGLLLYWFDEIGGSDSLINDFTYLNSSKSGFLDASFTKHLRTFGQSNDTTVNFASETLTSINDVINAYCEYYRIDVSTQPTIIPTNSYIKNKLIEQNSPVLVFGSLKSPTDNSSINHAVTAYGYTSTGDIIVHYGWSGYSNVVLNKNILGSALYISSLTELKCTMSDVSTSSNLYNVAQYCARYHLIPTSNGKFNGASSMTRGAFVNALYRLSGCPNIGSSSAVESKFTDFNSSSQYHDAAVWAYNNNILTGTTGTTLSLSASLTREQAVVFFYRLSNHLNCVFRAINGPSAASFSDYSDVSSFARVAMDWATKRNIVQGNNGLLFPDSVLSRSNCAYMIFRFATYSYRS